MNNPESPVLTIDEAAAYLKTSPRHIHRLRQDHQLPAIRLGGKVRFRVADLDAYIERNLDTFEGRF